MFKLRKNIIRICDEIKNKNKCSGCGATYQDHVVPAKGHQYSTKNVTGDGISYRRRYTSDSEDSYVLVNLFGQATFSNVLNGEYVELITGKTVNVSDGTLKTEKVESGNMRVYVLQNETAESYGATSKIGEDGKYLK